MTRLPGEQALDVQIMRREDDDWRLIGSRCPECHTTYFPPRALCAADLADCVEVELSPKGVVYEAALVRIPPVGFAAPYWVAFVDLPGGVRIFTQLDWRGEDDPEDGDAVECTFRTVRRDPYEVVGPVFAGPA